MGILVRNNKVISAGGKILYRNVSPFELPNLKLYLSATRMVQQADESSVSRFTDFSGNSYHATQATSGNQPKFDLNQFGSNAGIKFDGVDDFMALSGGALEIFRNINKYTVQCLFKRSTTSSTGYMLISSNNALTGGRGCGISYTSTSIFVSTRILDGTAEANITIPSNDLNTHFIQFTLNPSNSIVSAYLDGVLAGAIVVTSGNISNTSAGGLRIGGTQVGTVLYGTPIINAISINTEYSDPSTIQAQYRGYLSRGYL